MDRCDREGKREKVLHHHLVIEDIRRDGIDTVKLVKKLWAYGSEFFRRYTTTGSMKGSQSTLSKRRPRKRADGVLIPGAGIWLSR